MKLPCDRCGRERPEETFEKIWHTANPMARRQGWYLVCPGGKCGQSDADIRRSNAAGALAKERWARRAAEVYGGTD